MKRGPSPSVLFIRPDHLGDVLLTLPAVAALRHVLPEAQLTYAVPPATVSVPQHCAYLDAVLALPFPPPGRGAGTAGWSETVRGEAGKLADAFDAALVLRPDDPWSGELVAAAGIPIRLGFDMPRTRPFLTDVLPVPGNAHVATHAFALADALLARLGVDARTPRVFHPGFAVSEEEEHEAEAVLRDVHADERPIVLHPGSGWPLKNWPARRWREVAAELATRFERGLIVAGSGEEQALVREVAAGTPAIALAGRLSLGALAAVHRRARLVVATDSGALHLAAAMGAPVVGLFGPADADMFAPLCPVERRRIVRVALACSPCGTLEHPPCGAAIEPECIAAISVDAVVTAAEELLRDEAAAPAGARGDALRPPFVPAELPLQNFSKA